MQQLKTDVLPVRRSHILEESDIGDAGIIYKDIHTPEHLFNLKEQLLTASHIPHISFVCQAGDLEGFDFFPGLHQLFLPVDTADSHIIALLCKLNCHGLADASGGSGDQYGFTRHKIHILSVMDYNIFYHTNDRIVRN